MDYGAIITAIAAGITLIGAAYSLFKGSSIGEKAVDRTDQAEHRLSAEHSKLSAEYNKLSAEQRLILERTADSKRMTETVAESIFALRKEQADARTERQLRYASLDKAQQQLADSAQLIGRFSDEFARLAGENEALRKELEQAKIELAALRQSQRPSQNNDHDQPRSADWEMEI